LVDPLARACFALFPGVGNEPIAQEFFEEWIEGSSCGAAKATVRERVGEGVSMHRGFL
jgi:hypothetical protein